MKNVSLFLAVGLLAACSSPTDERSGQSATMPPAAPAASQAKPAASAPTTGVITAVDPAGKTVTIAHEQVPELQWPAMTMTFQAPDADLTAIKPGDRVSFEFTSSGMDGTITSLTHQ